MLCCVAAELWELCAGLCQCRSHPGQPGQCPGVVWSHLCDPKVTWCVHKHPKCPFESRVLCKATCLAPATAQTQHLFCLTLVCAFSNSSWTLWVLLPASIPEQSGQAGWNHPWLAGGVEEELPDLQWLLEAFLRAENCRSWAVLQSQFIFLSSSSPGIFFFLLLVKDRRRLVFCFLQASVASHMSSGGWWI